MITLILLAELWGSLQFQLALFSRFYATAQNLLNKPNKFIAGKKEGEWSEFNLFDTVDFNGNHHLPLYQHATPKNVVAEDLYTNGLKEGFWKEYYILNANDELKKGNIKSILEYKNDVWCGLDIEYYESGNIRAIGNYKRYPVDTSFKVEIPDFTNPNDIKMKDTLIHISAKTKPFGRWHFFAENGEIYNKVELNSE